MASFNLEHFKKEIKKLDESQSKIANRIGVSAPTVSKWLNGQQNPTIDNILTLSEEYNIPINQLLGVGSDSPDSKTKDLTASQICRMILSIKETIPVEIIASYADNLDKLGIEEDTPKYSGSMTCTFKASKIEADLYDESGEYVPSETHNSEISFAVFRFFSTMQHLNAAPDISRTILEETKLSLLNDMERKERDHGQH